MLFAIIVGEFVLLVIFALLLGYLQNEFTKMYRLVSAHNIVIKGLHDQMTAHGWLPPEEGA